MKRLGLISVILGFIFWYGISFFNYNNNNIINISETIYLILFFKIIFLFSYIFFYKFNNFQKLSKKIVINPNGKLFLIILIFILFSIQNYVSNLGTITIHINTAFSAILVYSYYFFNKTDGINKLTYFIICVFLFIILLDDYSRRYLLEAALAIIYLFLIENKKMKFQNFVKLVFFSSLILIFYFYLSGLRENDTFNSLLNNINTGIDLTFNAMGFDTIYLTDFVLNFYSSENFLYGESFFAGFVNFIPRAFWQSKPIAFSIILSSEYYNLNIDSIFTNFGPGIIAEAYANGGFISTLLFAMILGIAVSKFDNIIDNGKESSFLIITALILYPSLIFLVRGDFVNAFYDIYSRILVIIVIFFFTKKNFKQVIQ